jgi:AcrR family transcriptional regulator
MSDESPKGREQLVQAAIRLFGRDGYDATSVRDIAEDAGVSFALIRFYFGSKDGLREAAERRVIDIYMGLIFKALESPSIDSILTMIDSMTEALRDFPDATGLLRRMIMEDRPASRDFLRQLIEVDRHQAASYDGLDGDNDLVDPVANLAGRVGYILLAPQIENLLGRKVFSVEELKRRNARQARMGRIYRLGLAAERAQKAAKD